VTPSKFKADDARFRAVFDRIERYIEDRWQVPVRISDVPNPFTGDLDGEQIQVDYELDIEEAVFILIHLFGHTVQWNASEEARAVGLRRPGSSWSEQQLEEARHYEQEACRYSLQVLHDAGVRDLDQWLSDFSACDIAYLMHFYRTGEKRVVTSFWVDGTPLADPKPIPEFSPTRWIGRYDGTVI
jgi:hypothetical protein